MPVQGILLLHLHAQVDEVNERANHLLDVGKYALHFATLIGTDTLPDPERWLRTDSGSADSGFRWPWCSCAGLLQDEIRQSRESIVLLEAEQGLTLAAQQLQLAGNVPVALLALKSADAQLARMDTAEYLPLRKALAADIDRLEKLAPTDVVGLSLRLEKVLGGIDALPLALLARPETVPEAAPASDDRWWAQALLNAWREFKGLVRIQRFDGRDEALIAPGQEFLLRENLKLRLLNARLALFSRNVETFRSELTQADLWLGRHFSTDNPGVASARVTLQALAAAELSLVLPDLAASRKALADLNQARSAR